MTAPGWPAELDEGPVGLRPLRRRDAEAWRELRSRNARWLVPWEATAPDPGSPPISFAATVRFLRAEARAGRALPFVVTYDGVLVGQVTVSGITRGSLCSAQVGYWVDSAMAGRGIIPTAVAMVVDHCFGPVGLHRVEINIRPENAASLRVVEKLGFRDEGVRRRLLHIDGDWRDHRSFALLREEVPGGLRSRWRAVRQSSG
ncbi:ribosomal-protein-alanine N-acetyltransferase [Motilibacter peucedani]|uniref:Ribosomal-protein-alanine N-acetyltransferase n=1 Tax=Motilibacter peucedani TaxID=598650 RepID=A0A420XL70_9ACTN|nr:GNAT family protein [Motilibacter peucedani]RKS68587.1 ribosomal-protein-alanine N-acetyltransferase [Motilibacter peucedani]